MLSRSDEWFRMSDAVGSIASSTAGQSPARPEHRAEPLPEFPPDDPTLAHTPVTHASWHRAIGLTLRFETNDARIQQASRDSFGPRIDIDSGTEPDALIRIFVHHVDEEPGFHPRQPLVRAYDGAFWIAASRSSVVSGNVHTGSAMGFVSETIASNPDYLRTSIVQPTFLQIAQAQTLVAVHSACLALNGRAVMLRGESGTGKSTLAYAAIRRGYSLIAEDVIFVRSRSGQTQGRISPDDIELHGLPWTIHLLPDAGSLFPELAHVPVIERPDGRVKLRIALDDHAPGQTLAHASLGPLVFVSRSQHTAPRLTRLTRAGALTRLDATSIHYERDANTSHAIWDAFLSHPAYLLETSDNPHANAAMLDETVR